MNGTSTPAKANRRSRFGKPLLLTTLCALALSATPSWSIWPVGVGGMSADGAVASVTDSLGFTYTVGSYSGRAFFGSAELNSEGLSDIFVMKVNPNGDVVWVASAGGPSVDQGLAIALDPGENVYITGFFSKTATFTDAALFEGVLVGSGPTLPNPTPDPSTTTIPEDDYGEAFVAKLDTDGSWEWAAQVGDQGNEVEGHDQGNAIAFVPGDPSPPSGPPTSDGVVVGGEIRCNLRVDGDGDTAGSSGNCREKSDAFLGKLDTQGNWEWIRQDGQTGTKEEFITDLISTADGTLYAAGTYFSSTSFDGISVTPTTAATGIELSFWHKYLTETYFDGGVLEYSLNGGAWYDILAGPTPGVFLENGYNTNMTGSTSNTLSGRQAWSGSSSGYVRTRVDISAMADQNVRFRFRFGWDYSISPAGSIYDKGWWVDDIAMSNAGGVFFDENFNDTTCGYAYFFLFTPWLSVCSDSEWIGVPGPLNGSFLFPIWSWSQPSPYPWITRPGRSGNGMQVPDIHPGEVPFGLPLVARGDHTLIQVNQVAVLGSVPSRFFSKISGASQGTPNWDWVEVLPSGVDLASLAFRAESSVDKLYLTGASSKVASLGGVALGVGDGLLAKFDVDGQTYDWLQTVSNSTLTGVAFAEPATTDLFVSGTFGGSASFSGGVGPLTSAGDQDALVARVGQAGNWVWAESAGGPEFDQATDVTTSPDGTNVYLTGDHGMDALFGQLKLDASSGDTNVFIANISADADWFFRALLTWFVGAPVPRPPGTIENSFPVSQPEIILDNAPGTFTDYFFFSQANDTLYAIQPVRATIRWRTQAVNIDPNNDFAIEQVGESELPSLYCGTPAGDSAESCKQLHIAGAPVEITPPGVQLTFSTFGVLGSLGNNYDATASPDSRIEGDANNPVFRTDRPGFSTLVYVAGDNNPDILGSPIEIQVVESVRPDSPLIVDSDPVFTANAPCTVGSKLDTHPRHNEPGRTGYVLGQLAHFDGIGSSAAHNRESRQGPIIPVNVINPRRTTDIDGNGFVDQEMAVAWYHGNADNVYWPDRSTRFDCQWPANPDRIIIASQLGSEGLGQEVLDPVNFPSLSLYIQNDPKQPGFNPNDEHAILAPSNLGSGQDAVFAVRADFGQLANNQEASQPYSLVKYFDTDTQEWAFRVYRVQATGAGYNSFRFTGIAGNKINPPYPVVNLGGCPQTQGSGDPFFLDYQNFTWAKAEGDVDIYYWYPLQPGFHYDRDYDNQQDLDVFGCIPWMDLLGPTPPGQPILVEYSIDWPSDYPLLTVGETLVKPKRGLPDIYNQAAAEVIYDDLDPDLLDPFTSLGKMIDPLNPRRVTLTDSTGAAMGLPADVAFVLEGPSQVVTGSVDGVIRLPATVKSRILFDPLNSFLSWRGVFDESGSGEPLLLLNVMSARERDLLKGVSTNQDYRAAIDRLYALTRNPNQIDLLDSSNERDGVPDNEVLVGYQDRCYGNFCRKLPLLDPNTGDVLAVPGNPTTFDETGRPVGDGIAEPQELVGLNGAFTAGDSLGTGFVTFAFNNDPSVGSLPVSLNIIRVDCLTYPLPPEDPLLLSPYQGEVLVVESDNVFEEQLVLRHSGDFGGAPEDFDFEWFTRFSQGGGPPDFLPSPETGQLNGWLQFNTPIQGSNEITISGPTLQTLSDNWVVARYKRRRAPGESADVEGVCKNKDFYSVFAGKGGTPLDPSPQLAEGWIKRVIDGLNPFEIRYKKFHDSPVDTTVSMISQVGERYEGDIAFNPTAENLNQIGLLEAYETVLRRGLSLSVDAIPPVNFGPANQALLLVASRIVDFYMLLGNEAYADSLDPMIGFGTTSNQYGTLAPTIFAFQNQLSSLLEEELTLLRGRDNSQGPVEINPVYNRLYWNFTTGEGEFAYAQAYNITDQDLSGVINDVDARALYPQGHGDAWGHYLTAMQTYYKLLNHPFFSWLPVEEDVLVSGVPVRVDFEDERNFAQAAAAKARAGADIVDLTYRRSYVENPAGQWQGYKDTDPERAWGLSGWGRRAGQGAYFDWVVGNSILPSEDPDPEAQGIAKIDRQTVEDFEEVVAVAQDIQKQVDEADRGLNPLGLAKGVVPFDIDPSLLRFESGLEGQTHFEQILARAKEALSNTITVFNHANKLNELLRRNQDSVDDMRANMRDTELQLENRLIEEYGYPYPDDIGPGGTYPAGYEGPDLFHYMYIDQSDLTGTREAPAQTFTATFTPPNREDPFFGFGFNPAEDRVSLIDLPQQTLNVTYHTATGQADTFFLIKPPEWNSARRATGDLQDRLSDLLVAMNDYKIAVEEYDLHIKEIERAVGGLTRQHGVLARQIELENIKNGTIFGLDTAINVAKGVKLALEKAQESSEKFFESAEECVPDNLIAGLAGGGDIFSAAACAILGASAGTSTALGVGQTVADAAILAMDVAKDTTSLATDLRLRALSANADIKSRLGEIQSLVRQEATLRLEAFGKREIIEQERGNYLRSLAKGQRTLAELYNFRQKSAGDIQEYRFQDMAFRVFRNDALEKYRAQFDLAARYAYLAAAAYDYETNLLGSDPQAGEDFLTEIVRKRSIGQILDGEPVPGTRGLGDVLARMEQNFDVLKGQLGFNNPQIETTRFSLREQLFRLREDSDVQWRNKLEEYRVDNLFDVPAFRRFARPFAPESAGDQPGLVIPFSTTVNFGLNFFGYPLGPGDSAYDPSNFATKVRSVGVWLESYDDLPLSATPRVYLIPVGADVLRSPDSDVFRTREWSVVDQVLPVPFPIGGADLEDPTWIPEFDTLSGFMGEVRRFSSMRAYSLSPDDENIDLAETTTDSRLVGRSVWNTQWLLIIPGGTTLFDPDEGLETLINGQEVPGMEGQRDGEGITDIELFFSTYAFSGN